MGIKITADRMIDLTFEELAELDIDTMPCYINMANSSFEDLKDVFPDDVFNYFETTGKLAMTAAKSPDDYYDFFLPYIEQGHEIIHFAASSGISSICDNARIASKKLDDKVHVIDSKNLSNAIAILAKHAIAQIKGGQTDPKIVVQSCLELLPRVNGSFLIDDLIYLYKGGRCSALSFYAANLLKIRPVIYLDEQGRMKVREKVKGSKEKCMITYIRKTLEAWPPNLDFIYFITTSPSEALNQSFLNIVRDLGYNFKNVYFNVGSCNCAVHSGRNTIGIFYLNK